MARSRRVSTPPSARGGYRNRHGRGLRSSVTGPHLPVLRTRAETFEGIVAETADYLRGQFPEELADVSFEIAGIPRSVTSSGLDRWWVDAGARRVVLYRLPIERLQHLHADDEAHQRMHVEGYVFKAVAELLGKDPWDLAPDRYHHF
ncbi:metallopeptidase family protein [Amnibacterium sp. CER49]|uniref:metallopeptidase family protein n=1 Tax=Amnibacterium sp. CER49 TaxID=3039161 RepID=UPI00244BA766|nr:metallopeptidase family protein [Amnibacterium sp. CER49]MDH2442972.1 metallopeptidase family protein [Amnibacterium sp. CER49]